MSSKCSAASLTGVFVLSQLLICPSDSNISTSLMMMLKTMQHPLHTSCLRTFFGHLLLPQTLGLRWQPFYMAFLHQITNKSKKSRSVMIHYELSSMHWFRATSKAVAWVPQRGSNNSVELPTQVPKDDFLLKDLEPLGWIKTQALEIAHLSPTDVTAQAKLMADHPEWGSSSICLTASFTPGSVSLSAHSLTVPGFEWGRKNQDTSVNPPVSPWKLDHCQVSNLLDRDLTLTCQNVFNFFFRTVFLGWPLCLRDGFGTMELVWPNYGLPLSVTLWYLILLFYFGRRNTDLLHSWL